MLYLIGAGLYDHKDLTVRAVEVIKTCKYVYLEGYTSLLHSSLEDISAFLGKNVQLVDREFVEQKTDTILAQAKDANVAVLIIGDVFGATTHVDVLLKAQQAGVHIQVLHNSSILTAIGHVGLELYKYGKTTSLPYFTQTYRPRTPYDVLKANKEHGYHTLVLLDIQAEHQRYMSVAEAAAQLLSLEEEHSEGVLDEHTVAIGCARIGAPDAHIVCATLGELQQKDLGGPLHCLIIPGNLHFVEEEALQLWK